MIEFNTIFLLFFIILSYLFLSIETFCTLWHEALALLLDILIIDHTFQIVIWFFNAKPTISWVVKSSLFRSFTLVLLSCEIEYKTLGNKFIEAKCNGVFPSLFFWFIIDSSIFKFFNSYCTTLFLPFFATTWRIFWPFWLRRMIKEKENIKICNKFLLKEIFYHFNMTPFASKVNRKMTLLVPFQDNLIWFLKWIF